MVFTLVPQCTGSLARSPMPTPKSVVRPTLKQTRQGRVASQQKDEGGQQIVTQDREINTDQTRVENIEPGNISPENAEARANLGQQRPPSFFEAQAFDGPAPETINGRLCMLAVTSALGAEFATNVGIKQQVAQEPLGVLASFVIISLASYIPISRGFTRKEPFSNSFWNPQAENWNGRLAMVGFSGILITEALSGKTIPEFYGLPHGGI